MFGDLFQFRANNREEKSFYPVPGPVVKRLVHKKLESTSLRFLQPQFVRQLSCSFSHAPTACIEKFPHSEGCPQVCLEQAHPDDRSILIASTNPTT